MEKDSSPPLSSKAIQVVIRKRPLIDVKEDAETDIVRCSDTTVTVYEQKIRLDLTPVVEPTSFEFDNVFDESNTTAQIYKECCEPLLESVCSGGGAIVFAFGQTGSGKTFTTLGSEKSPGLYGLAVTDLLAFTKGEQSLTVSFYEVYGTKIFDLLNDRSELKMLQDGYKNEHIVGLKRTEVQSVDDIQSLMARGQTLRAIGTTHANDWSSRSHAVLEINVQMPDQSGEGRFTFVDLAGSERGTDTVEMDHKTRREGAEINKSLLALKECIRSMCLKKRHVPFRGSKLTRILRESFVGRCKTVVIATISPCQRHCEDTLNTLRYAYRIKELKSTNPTALSSAPTPCTHCGLPIFIGDRHCCLRINVQCPHCRQEMDKSELDAHLGDCKEAPMRCPYCNERFLRVDQAKHNRKCTKLPTRCPSCSQMVARNQLERHTQLDCLMAREKCRYCRSSFLPNQLALHEQNCGAMMKACDHCLQFVRKNRMEAHLQQCIMNPTRVCRNGRKPTQSLQSSLSKNTSQASLTNTSRSRSFQAGSLADKSGDQPHTSVSATSSGKVVASSSEFQHMTRSIGAADDNVVGSPDELPLGSCPFERYGCSQKVSSASLNDHLEGNVQYHLDMVLQYADKLDVQNAELRGLLVNPTPNPLSLPRRSPRTSMHMPSCDKTFFTN